MSRLTLPELNALDAISWHTGEAGGVTRTLSDFRHRDGSIEFTIVWDFDYDDAASETQHVRIAKVGIPSEWWLLTLDNPHGNPDPNALAVRVVPEVIQRIRTEPDAFAGGAPTRRFAVAFYGGEI